MTDIDRTTEEMIIEEDSTNVRLSMLEALLFAAEEPLDEKTIASATKEILEAANEAINTTLPDDQTITPEMGIVQ